MGMAQASHQTAEIHQLAADNLRSRKGTGVLRGDTGGTREVTEAWKVARQDGRG
jgi:hypothetical protein